MPADDAPGPGLEDLLGPRSSGTGNLQNDELVARIEARMPGLRLSYPAETARLIEDEPTRDADFVRDLATARQERRPDDERAAAVDRVGRSPFFGSAVPTSAPPATAADGEPAGTGPTETGQDASAPERTAPDPDAYTVSTLATLLATQPGPDLQLACVDALGGLLRRSATVDGDRPLRGRVEGILIDRYRRGLEDEGFLPGLDDGSDLRVRASIVRSLSGSRRPEVLDFLFGEVCAQGGEDEPTLQVEALRGFAGDAPPEVVRSTATVLLRTAFREVASEAARILGEVRDRDSLPDVLQALASCVRSGRGASRTACLEALRRIVRDPQLSQTAGTAGTPLDPELVRLALDGDRSRHARPE